MKNLFRIALPFLLLIVVASAVSAQDEVSVSSRLLLADSAGMVHVMDANEGEVIAMHDLHEDNDEAARLYVGPSGQYVFAVLRSSNMIRVFDSGFAEDGMSMTDVNLMDFSLNTMMPTHFDIYGDQIASFNDGDGTVTVFSEAIFNGGGLATTYFTGQSHHGVAVLLDDVLIATNPTEEAFLPIGPAVFNLNGERIAAFDNCPGLHGKAILSDQRVVFGCDDGVSIVSYDGEAWVADKIEETADARIGNFTYNPTTDVLLGNWGGGYALVDVEAGTIEAVELPAPTWISPPAFNPANDDQVIVLTRDGSLHTVDAVSGEVIATAENVVTEYIEPEDEDQTVPRPTLSVDGGFAYISDPVEGTFHIVQLSDMSVVDTIELGVHITSIAVLGS